MAVTILKIVEDNTSPALSITCKRDGVVINLTGSTVVLIIARGATITNAGGACTLTDATNGVISYQPVVTDFPLPGKYKGDVKITYPSGGVEVIYEQLLWQVRKRIQ